MNIHEYQAKAVLREFGVPVPRGIAAMSVDEAVKAANAILEAFRPTGDKSAKPVGDFANLPIASWNSIGEGFVFRFEREIHYSPNTILLMIPFWISLLPP